MGTPIGTGGSINPYAPGGVVSSDMLSAAFSSYPASPNRIGFFEDFNSGEAYTTRWTYTQYASGTSTILTADGTSRRGVLQMSTVDTTASKGSQLQMAATPFVQFADAHDIVFGVMVAPSTITDHQQWIAGYTNIGTAMYASGALNLGTSAGKLASGLVFVVGDASGLVSLNLYAAGVLVNSWPVTTLVAGVYTDLSYMVRGVASGVGFLDINVGGVQIATGPISGLPNTKALCATMAQSATSAGASGAAYFNIDDIYGWQYR